MSQAAIAQKTDTPLHDPTKCREEAPGSRTDRSLARCVRRNKLQYSQLPIRCQRHPYYRPAKSPFKLTNAAAIGRVSTKTTKSCPDASECSSSAFTPFTRRFKKSLSMIDLLPTSNDSETRDFRSNSAAALAQLEEVNERTAEPLGDGAMSDSGVGVGMWIGRSKGGDLDSQLQNTCKAAGLVCHVLVVNAWRRRREEIAHLQETIERLRQQMGHLHIQIVVLRRLLDTENNRVAKLTAETNRVKLQLEDVSRERDTFKTEKEALENETKHFRELSEERTMTMENLRNELLTAQTQLHALDVQMTRDREKLLKLREDKKILLDKVTTSEELASERGARIDRAENTIKDLGIKLAAQIDLVAFSKEEAQRYFKEMKLKEEQKLKLEERLLSSGKAEQTLSLRVTDLKSQLSDREAALRRLESMYNSQLVELNDLRERLARQSQEGGWSSRVLQIAGSVVRAPRAILRTLSFLSNTGAPLPT